MLGFEASDPAVVIGRALGVSLAIAALMLLASLGFIYMFSSEEGLLPNGRGIDLGGHAAVFLVVFAVSFIAAFVLLDRASSNLPASFLGGAAIAFAVTVFAVALVAGACAINDGMRLPGADLLLTGFAACLVVALIVNRLTVRL